MSPATLDPNITPPESRHPEETLDTSALAVSSFGLTDPGRVRPANEDHFLIAETAKAMRVRHTSLPQPATQYSEKRGHLLLCSTNLTLDELRQRYGERTIDRLRAIVRPVAFSGASLRGAGQQK